MFGMFGMASRAPVVKSYTPEEQQALASKTVRKVRAFLHGAYRFEARYADYPNERDVIESGGVVLTGAQLREGTRYNVFWDFEGESGNGCWKFRGAGGFPGAVCDMEDSMADDPNIGSPGSLLQMAASDWEQSFFDMAANYEAYGSVVRPEEPRPPRPPRPERDLNHEARVKVEDDKEGVLGLARPDGDPDHEDRVKAEDDKEGVPSPRPESDPDHEGEDRGDEYDEEEEDYEPDYASMVAAKWNPIFERFKADKHDVECMFFHTTQRCLAPDGTCPYKHTPRRDIPFADGGHGRISQEDAYAYNFYMDFCDSD
ncbi:hypothetical protein DFH06DRAFT_1469938 [Mycena polygramma]|nr:hypothetical protein DFH06DRAFT_1469938 [Mycena polygramma]